MKRILLDAAVHQTRIALVDDGELVELIYDNKQKESIVGNIYIGRVNNVLPGMLSAFVDIGSEKNAYLSYAAKNGVPGENKPKIGQEVIVQVEKDGAGSKGPVVTTKLSFPGKFIVLIPNDSEIGISKKITETQERLRIKNIAEKLIPDNYGMIIRTEGRGRSEEDYHQEINSILSVSEQVIQKGTYLKAPAMLHKDISPALKAAREFFTDDIDEFIVNNKEEYENLLQITEGYGDHSKKKLRLYEYNVPIFDNFFVESQIEKAFQKRAWLKSGGFLIIEQTEACVVIDVNTGKYTGKKDLQTTIKKTNLEAADEVAKQIRLRNLSGMIIVDFIDMEAENDKIELRHALEKAVNKDRVKTVVVGMTELGLMQLTRKKTRPPLLIQNTITCQCCNGSGRAPALDFVVDEIRRKVISIFTQTIYDKVTVTADVRLLRSFEGSNSEYKNQMETIYGKSIILCPADNMTFGKYEINGEKVHDRL